MRSCPASPASSPGLSRINEMRNENVGVRVKVTMSETVDRKRIACGRSSMDESDSWVATRGIFGARFT
jgi:hypothetical protein